MFRTILLSLAALGLVVATPIRRANNNQAAYEPYQGTNGDRNVIDGEYIIHFHGNHSMALHESHVGQNISDTDGFREFPWLPGYKARLNNHTFHEIVRRDPGVSFSENNLKFSFTEYLGDNDDDLATSENDTLALDKRAYQTSVVPDAPYNLRMVAAPGKLTTPVMGNGDYLTLRNSGAGVNIYVFDTGMRITHENFGGRAFNFQGYTTSPYANGAAMDDSDDPPSRWRGHGTHVAGIAGANTYGVAEWATLVNVRVIQNDGSFDISELAAAVSDVVLEHTQQRTNPTNPNGYVWRGSVINMSLGSTAYNKAFQRIFQYAASQGVATTAAAGNEDAGAGQTFPCAFSLNAGSGVTCVANVNRDYQKYVSSNYGKAVNVAAPGTSIKSCNVNSDTDTKSRTGTSMAAPHVAGMLANFIYWEALNADSEDLGNLQNRLYANTYENIMSGFPDNEPNLFATTGIQNPDKEGDVPYVNAPEIIVAADLNQVKSALSGASTAVVGQYNAINAAEAFVFATETDAPTLPATVTATLTFSVPLSSGPAAPSSAAADPTFSAVGGSITALASSAAPAPTSAA